MSKKGVWVQKVLSQFFVTFTFVHYVTYENFEKPEKQHFANARNVF